ncbi:Cox15 protein [Thecamonas trahens ATCC 50062]|uniref:Cox15 protein n=1 Tax=Thecamonas trahens ATCC 50062 TaxID=461836 RepID=A0A0L0DHY4_THETB|nr:Cox15 protein [Thecamonas trahens ATCC 50062]KNC50913.1 Cox15 protein [Thecamonas trahens ATCC 50062]|eukprot:XP_013756613.1 Cox15 protein [Thecamonas trahens ATCC 50062]
MARGAGGVGATRQRLTTAGGAVMRTMRAMQSLAGSQGSKAVRNWLGVTSGLVYGMVVLGGVTRLTESGLSMTTWSVTGSLPPSTDEEWAAEFAKYQDSPEYEILNKGMTVDEFKRIFYFEYSHRMLGRLIGAAFVLPMGYFWARGVLTTPLKKALLAIGAMIGGQGLLGWYMVKSGLKDEFDASGNAPPRVSQYRLAAHLSSALAIYSAMLWTMFNVGTTGSPPLNAAQLAPRALSVLRNKSTALLGVLGVTIVSGAFVAGLDAGLVYNEFPLMGGSIIPSDIVRDDLPLWRNVFENDVMVQFNHRLLGLTTASGVLAMWAYASRLPLPRPAKIATNAAAALVVAQASLGISTLLMFVPVKLAAMHQAGSVALLSSLLWLLHVLRRVRI